MYYLSVVPQRINVSKRSYEQARKFTVKLSEWRYKWRYGRPARRGAFATRVGRRSIGRWSFDARTEAEAAESLRRRAATARSGRGPRCADPAGIAAALDVAATALKLMRKWASGSLARDGEHRGSR